MAVIFEDSIKRDIAKKELAPVYLLFGDDTFLKKHYCDSISALTADKDDIFNYQRFEGGSALQDVYDAVTQLPMMSDKKCVILSDCDYEHIGKTDFDKLASLLSDSVPSTVFIVVFDNIEFDYKKNSKAKKLVSAAEKGGGKAVCLDHRKPAELVKMMSDGALKRGCKMDSATSRYLIETAGQDMSTLKNELDKLCLYSNGKEITKQTVDLVSVKTIEASVYNLTREIIACRADAALNIIDELFFMRIEPMIILHTVSSSYVDMYRIYAAKAAGSNISDVSKQFGYRGREFVLERAAANLRKFDFNKLMLSFNALLDADKRLKSVSADARTVLEQLCIRLIYIISKGESVD